jgi:hypothetical protein
MILDASIGLTLDHMIANAADNLPCAIALIRNPL